MAAVDAECPITFTVTVYADTLVKLGSAAIKACDDFYAMANYHIVSIDCQRGESTHEPRYRAEVVATT